MSELEAAIRRLIAERNRNVHQCAYRADLWNDVLHALEPPALPLAPRVIGTSAAVVVIPFGEVRL